MIQRAVEASSEEHWHEDIRTESQRLLNTLMGVGAKGKGRSKKKTKKKDKAVPVSAAGAV